MSNHRYDSMLETACPAHRMLGNRNTANVTMASREVTLVTTDLSGTHREIEVPILINFRGGTQTVHRERYMYSPTRIQVLLLLIWNWLVS